MHYLLLARAVFLQPHFDSSNGGSVDSDGGNLTASASKTGGTVNVINPTYVDPVALAAKLEAEKKNRTSRYCGSTSKASTAKASATKASTKSSNSNKASSNSGIEKSEKKGITYICNVRSKKFHKPRCKSVKKMSDGNKMEVDWSRSECIANGYDPCHNCNP